MAHILVLEDNHDMMMALNEVLNMHGHTVAHGYSGQEGVRIITTGNARPDLILSDVTMPDMDGFEFLEYVQNQPNWAGIPFAIMSGRRTDEKIAIELGASAFIMKPFKFDELTATLEHLLASR
ncbi:MAG: response regulator [Aggregatilineales bacterium]